MPTSKIDIHQLPSTHIEVEAAIITIPAPLAIHHMGFPSFQWQWLPEIPLVRNRFFADSWNFNYKALRPVRIQNNPRLPALCRVNKP